MLPHTEAMPAHSEAVEFSARLREAMTEAGKAPDTRGVKAALARRHNVKGPTAHFAYSRVVVPAFEVRGVEDGDGLDPEKEVMLPVYDIEVSGGPGIPVPEFVETRYRLPYQLWWFKAVGAKVSDILVMKVRGNSMDGLLWAGDKAIIHRGRTKVRDDCVYALLYAGEARVKRLFNTPGGGLRIVSNNEDKSRYPDEFVPPDQMHRRDLLTRS